MEFLQFKAHLHSSENFNSETSYGGGILILVCLSDFVFVKESFRNPSHGIRPLRGKQPCFLLAPSGALIAIPTY